MALNNDFGLYALSAETNVEQLLPILNSASIRGRIVAGFEGLSVGADRSSLGIDCDEVYPNIFVGDAESARSTLYLKHLGVSHLLNASEGVGPGMVDTGAQYYHDCGIIYMGLSIVDDPISDIYQHFDAAAHFVECGVRSGGKVLVHCMKGQSRSATLVLAYLMVKMLIPLPMALRLLRQKRSVQPNSGFLQQLVNLDVRLRSAASLLPQ